MLYYRMHNLSDRRRTDLDEANQEDKEDND